MDDQHVLLDENNETQFLIYSSTVNDSNGGTELILPY